MYIFTFNIEAVWYVILFLYNLLTPSSYYACVFFCVCILSGIKGICFFVVTVVDLRCSVNVNHCYTILTGECFTIFHWVPNACA